MRAVAENYQEATLLLTKGCDYGCPHAGCAHERAYIARAQVHALLALVAVFAPGISTEPDRDPNL